ncbi:addiction module protein [Gracilimonas sp.]|uniref:addiction module protein n=1 Tax=Gracilimonas sp. TaxID=1974203 RepID=UPI002871DC63|nr:addiction module protein [Gracilimonas sp.]
MIKEKIQEEVLKLSKKDRAELARLLIESLPVERKYESEEAWAKELKRRIDQYESGEGSSTSWSEVKKNAKAMLDK